MINFTHILVTLYNRPVVNRCLKRLFAHRFIGQPLYRGLRFVAHFWLNEGRRYQQWMKKNEPTSDQLDQQREETFSCAPTISVVIPAYHSILALLRAAIESVQQQTYPHWQLCIANVETNDIALNEYLAHCLDTDQRICITQLPKNLGISENTNQAIALATGEFVGFLDHDDTLAPFALYEIVTALNQNPSLDFLYSDEDLLSTDGQFRFRPHFKPDFAPDTLRSNNYICHFSVVRRTLGEQIGWLRKGFEGAQDHDFVLRVTEITKRIRHIPKILYHWRLSEQSVAQNPGAKRYAYESGKKAIEGHLARLQYDGKVHVQQALLGTYRIDYQIPDPSPRVSLIILNRDNVEDLKRLIDSILEKTTYPNYEILIVENGSQNPATHEYYRTLAEPIRMVTQVVTETEPFNYSAANNFATQYATGDLYCFLNNDMAVINPEWLTHLVAPMSRQEVGIIGGKLYYPDKDKTIQHAGIVVGICGVAGHIHKHMIGCSPGYMFRLAILNNVSAVTGACLMIKKALFQTIGGFDPDYLLAFGDVDLCLKVREAGYLILFTPYAELYHFESKTRGYEDTEEKKQRFQLEIDRFSQNWQHFLPQTENQVDPYYNPNLDTDSADFRVAAGPRPQ